MDEQNTGSFGAALGGVSALKNAMARRGMDMSALDQMSAAAPGQQVAPPDVEGQISSGASPVGASPGQPKQQTRSAEMDIALKALKGVVDTENKIAQAVLGLR